MLHLKNSTLIYRNDYQRTNLNNQATPYLTIFALSLQQAKLAV